MKKPLISVLLPIYKTPEKYLIECVESILSQTFTDFEFLILDDCPEDKNAENIIRKYSDKRIKYYRNSENLGISGSRNKLLDLSNGQYLAVMDHDDISLPTRFEEQVQFLEAHPEIGVVGCWYQRFPNQKLKKKPILDEDIKHNLFDGCPILHPASMIRKSVLEENNIRYEAEFSPAEDLALWCRLSKVTCFANIPKVLFNYRDYGNNTSKLFHNKLMTEGEHARERLKTENPELWQRAKIAKQNKGKFFSKQIFPILDGYERDYKLFGLPIIQEKYTTTSFCKQFCGIKFFEEIQQGDLITLKLLSISIKKTRESLITENAVNTYKKLHSKPLVIFFDHALGGGTETYFRNQCNELLPNFDLIRIQYLPKKLKYKISFYISPDDYKFIYIKDINNFYKYILDFHPQEIVVNNLVGYASSEAMLFFIGNLKKELKNVKVSARGHDFHSICPSYNLLSSQNKFCNVPVAENCKKCFHSLRLADNQVQHRNLMSGATDIVLWRQNWQKFYEEIVDELIVFGEAIKEIFEKAYPCLASKITVIPHKVAPLREVKIIDHEEINICILGNIKLLCKGKQIVKDMALSAAGKKINIIVLGGFEKKAENVINIGKYKRNLLPHIIEEQKIDIVFIPSIWPETFSYTTAEAMLMGLPVACFDIGTPAERIKKYSKGLVISNPDAQTALNEIIEFVIRMRKSA